MITKVVPEILAPCGSYDILVAAVKAGADACYIGGDRFGARAYAPNLNAGSYRQAIEYAHLHNTRIYLTVNTLLKDNEINEFVGFLQPYYEIGLDAVIVQDLGAFKVVKENFPDLKIHCSTQMNITSLSAAAYMKEMGATRVVTAREMSLEEIRRIKENVDIEIETFVHGAMCYSYSGQCLMSSLAGGRSGNRGRCAQPCRKCYDGAYLLSMKDMCTLEILPEILDTGIDSLKIEGRMKNEYYVASAVDAYKELANDWAQDCFSLDKALSYKKRLANVFNRGGFCTGYFKQHNGRNMISEARSNNQGIDIGYVEDISAGGVIIHLNEKLHKGDVLEIGLDDSSVIEITSPSDFESGAQARLNAPKSRRILKDGRVLRTRCNYILDDIRENILKRDDKMSIDGIFAATPGERMSFTLSRDIDGNIYSATAFGDIVDRAKHGSPDIEKIRQKLAQFGDTDYCIENIHMEVADDSFIPASAIKKLRREALCMLESEILSRSRRNRCRNRDKLENPDNVSQSLSDDEDVIHTIHKDISFRIFRIGVRTYEQLLTLLELLDNSHKAEEDCAITAVYMGVKLYRGLKPCDIDRIKSAGISIYIEFPYVVRDDFDVDALRPDMSVVKGFYLRNIGGYAALKASKLYERVEGGELDVIIGSSLYAYNQQAADFIGDYTYENPQELRLEELAELYKGNAYRGELLVYGYQQVMVSAQCITGNFDGCIRYGNNRNNRNGNTSVVKRIRDDKGNVFFALNCCEECVNIIYNGVPYSVLDRLDEIEEKISPDSYLVNFTIEDEDTERTILNEILNSSVSGGFNLPEGICTAGHIYRGVE